MYSGFLLTRPQSNTVKRGDLHPTHGVIYTLSNLKQIYTYFKSFKFFTIVFFRITSLCGYFHKNSLPP